jgi:hypothetical protein
MQGFKKYISCFLLAVFAMIAVPSSLFHEIFANHTDIADNHCRYYHKGLGRHIEEQQNHCDIFKADTPVYDAVKILHEFNLALIVISEYKSGEVFSYSLAKSLRLPSRAPPLA